MEPLFNVVFHGELLQGHNIDQVKQRIAALYKMPTNKFDHWFSGKPVIIKKSIDLPTAKKYLHALKNVGMICRVEPAEPIQKTPPAIEKDPGQHQMICPKCGFEQPSDEVCSRCGVIIGKYIKHKQSAPTRPKSHERTPQVTRKSVRKSSKTGVIESLIDRGLDVFGREELKRKRKTKFVLAGILCFVVLSSILGGIYGLLSESPKQRTVESQSKPSNAQVVNDRSLIPYTIITRDEVQPFKVSFDIRVDLVDGRLPTAEELGAISMFLYSQEKKHDRTFVAFFLPKMVPGMGAFATAHHDPEMRVVINEEYIPAKYKGEEQPTELIFSSISEMIEEFGNYSVSNGTFKVLQENPIVHIQISPIVFEGELQDVIEEEIKRVMLEIIYETFLHTHLSTLKITVIPMDFDIQTQTGKYLPVYSTTLQIGKAEATNVINTTLKIASLNDLVEMERIGETLYPRWSQEFEKSLYNDYGEPTLDQFFWAVSQVAQK